MNTPKQLTPKPVPKSTPNSAGKIKKSNKKKSPKTPNSVGKTKVQEGSVQKTPKLAKTPQTNGKSSGKKGLKTPKLKKTPASGEDNKTPRSPAIANNTSDIYSQYKNETALVKKQKKSLENTELTPQPLKAQKRKQSPDAKNIEATPPTQAKTSADSKEDKPDKKAHSAEKRIEMRKKSKERHQQFLSKLSMGDQAALAKAETFKARLVELLGRPKLSKSGLRVARRYRSYLKVGKLIQIEDKSNLNESALKQLKNFVESKSKNQVKSSQKPDGKKSTNNEQQTKNKQNNNKTTKRINSKKSCSVSVKNLPDDIQVEEVTKLFGQIGKVVRVKVTKKGRVFVHFENEENAKKALTFHEKVFQGQKLRVTLPEQFYGTKVPKET